MNVDTAAVAIDASSVTPTMSEGLPRRLPLSTHGEMSTSLGAGSVSHYPLRSSPASEVIPPDRRDMANVADWGRIWRV